MQQIALLALLSFWCTPLISGVGGCLDGPGNCRFLLSDYSEHNQSVCSWSLEGLFKFHYYQFSSRSYLEFILGEKEVRLTSRTACATRGQTHCLCFLYNLQFNDVTDLSVSIQYEGTDEAESLLWISSRSYGWDYGCVQMNADRDFLVVFKAKKRLETDSKVFIDSLSYVNADRCVPHTAASRFTAEPTTAQITTTRTTTTKEAIIETEPDALSNPYPATHYSTSITRVSTILPTHHCDNVQSEQSSNTVVVILSVIVAILIVIIIIMAVLLVRGIHFQFLKACCRKKQPLEQFHMNASHNVAYSLEANDISHTNEPDINNSQQNSDNQSESTQNSINHRPEKPQASNETAAPVYAVTNKPRKVKQENSPSSPFQPDTTVYELCNEHAMDRTKAAETEYQNLPPTVAKLEKDSRYNSSTPKPTVTGGNHLAKTQNPNSVYHILEKGLETDIKSVTRLPNTGEDGEYNRLDLDTRSCDEEKSEEATGGVYSHMNEGGEDTYNKVHREKRDDVIDGVYSHLK